VFALNGDIDVHVPPAQLVPVGAARVLHCVHAVRVLPWVENVGLVHAGQLNIELAVPPSATPILVFLNPAFAVVKYAQDVEPHNVPVFDPFRQPSALQKSNPLGVARVIVAQPVGRGIRAS